MRRIIALLLLIPALTFGQLVDLDNMVPQGANTIIGNGTGSPATLQALSMTSCSTSASAVKWTAGSGFGCNTALAAATAAKWVTARNLAGNSTDGSADVPFANKFIVQGTADSGLSGAQFMGALGTGILKNTTSTGVLSAAAYGDVTALWTTGGVCSASTYLRGDGTCASPSGAGTVTTVSVVSANGFAGTVANPTSTPAITLTTSVGTSGTPLMLKGNGTAIESATAGTDYSAGTSALATGILKSTTSTGALTIAVAADFPTLNQNTSGTATYATNLAGGAATEVPYQTGSGATSFSGSGTSGQVLALNVSGVPTWTTFTASTATNIAGGLANEVLYQSSAGNTTFTAQPTAGQVLIANGSSVPTWTLPIPIASGGTGSATQNFVDLSTVQSSIGGAKTFTSTLTAGGGAFVVDTSGNTSAYTVQVGTSSMGNFPYGGYYGISNISDTTDTSHASSALAELQIFRYATASQANGPATADTGLVVGAAKKSYLSSTTTGEVDGISVVTQQGIYGDSAAYLANATKVSNGSSSYGVLGMEAASTFVNSSGTVQQQMHNSIGWMTDDGSSFWGFDAEKWVGSGGSAYLVDTNGGAWTNALQVRSGRNNANNTFVLTAAGAITTVGSITSSGTITASAFSGNASSATDASYATVVDDASTNANRYLVWSAATSGNQRMQTSGAYLYFNSNSGQMTVGSITSPGIIQTTGSGYFQSTYFYGGSTTTLAVGGVTCNITRVTVATVPNILQCN